MLIENSTIKFCSCSSGSSGNSYVVATDNATILVDAGTSGKNMIEGLARCGRTPADVDAIFLTHEHHDHVRGLPVIIKEINKQKLLKFEDDDVSILPIDQNETRKDNSNGGQRPRHFAVYGSAGTIAATEERLYGKTELSDALIIGSPLEEIEIGDIKVFAFRLSHDAAEPYGYRIDAYGKSLAIVTDTGHVPDSIYRAVKDVDFLVLEANHEQNILLMGRYPYELKMRILGEYGHLSNDAAGAMLASVLDYRTEQVPDVDYPAGQVPENRMLQIALAHLSKDNNTPSNARITIQNILLENNYMEDRDYTLEVLERDIVGRVFIL